MASADPTFEEMVEHFVMEAVRERSLGSLDELVVHLPGVYPTEAAAAVERLGRRGDVDSVTLARLRRRSATDQPASPPGNSLPVPHPLDFDWRFSPCAVDRLVRECQSRASGTRPILLGAPSVFCALRRVESVPPLLLDSNPSIIGALGGTGSELCNARLCDLRRDKLPDEQSAVVVVDPPWYLEHERLFLWAAAELCQLGGSVLVSVPAVGTRPGVTLEREQALAWARHLGFDVEGMDVGALGYVSPPFERNALAAVGLGGMPNEWRHGDLVILRMREHTETPKPECAVDNRWPEVMIGSVRVRVRSTEDSEGVLDPRLRKLVPGDILDSVSRRDPRRQKVAMWTTGNRVFASRSCDTLLEVVRSLAEGRDPHAGAAALAGRRLTTAEKDNIRTAARQVAAVVEAERAELVAMGWAA